ncbi:MAG: hypothetical protein HYY35_01435 [Deltaproteobacteria bacterium]|nr:hypothetical protein [Deltaproteobacteria bacterium]
MKRSMAVVMIAAALAGGCRLYLWAGSHELVIPPHAEATPTPAASAQPTPPSVY